jgi:hypothetical protein
MSPVSLVPEQDLHFVLCDFGPVRLMSRLEWRNIDADDLPMKARKALDAVEACGSRLQARVGDDLMPEDKYLIISRKGRRLGVAFVDSPHDGKSAGTIKFKTK